MMRYKTTKPRLWASALHTLLQDPSRIRSSIHMLMIIASKLHMRDINSDQNSQNSLEKYVLLWRRPDLELHAYACGNAHHNFDSSYTYQYIYHVLPDRYRQLRMLALACTSHTCGMQSALAPTGRYSASAGSPWPALSNKSVKQSNSRISSPKRQAHRVCWACQSVLGLPVSKQYTIVLPACFVQT